MPRLGEYDAPVLTLSGICSGIGPIQLSIHPPAWQPGAVGIFLWSDRSTLTLYPSTIPLNGDGLSMDGPFREWIGARWGFLVGCTQSPRPPSPLLRVGVYWICLPMSNI